jgi:hypothetical protein
MLEITCSVVQLLLQRKSPRPFLAKCFVFCIHLLHYARHELVLTVAFSGKGHIRKRCSAIGAAIEGVGMAAAHAAFSGMALLWFHLPVVP